MQGRTRLLGFGVIVASSLALSGCLPLTIAVPERTNDSDQKPASVFIAGVGKSDITPIPGVALGSYSIDGKMSRGFWTRLHARALYLRGETGTPLVLVSADLGAIPGGLGDEVTRRLHETAPALTWISREHLLLAATHTHHGPGNFYTTEMYNGLVSPRPFFDDALFRFLARRIADAIVLAYQDARPAELLATDAFNLQQNNDWDLDYFFRNRSFQAFLRNPDAHNLLDQDVPIGCTVPPDDPRTVYREDDERACRAVRPQVEMLAIRRLGTAEPLGIAAFVPVHPTVLPPRLEVFSSDLFGVAALGLENASQCAGKLDSGAVVAFFNGASGDISPTWKERNRKEVMERGEQLGKKVCDLLAHLKPVPPPLNIRFRHKRVKLANRTFTDLDQRPRRTTRRSRSGAAAAGGAEDGRSVFHRWLGHREDRTRVERDDHGPKPKVGEVEIGIDLDLLSAVTSPAPDVVPLAVYDIGDTTPNVVIAAVPGELTTRMGEAVREAVHKGVTSTPLATPAKPAHVLLAGLANEYVGYFTTPEEYDAQHYEGSSTLYGPASGPLLAVEIQKLAAQSKNLPEDPTPWVHEYEPGMIWRSHPRYIGEPVYFKDDGLADLIQDKSSNVRRDLPRYCWHDAVPVIEGLFDPPCQRSNPEVTVMGQNVNTGAKSRVDGNDGTGVVTVVTELGRDGVKLRTEWCAIWVGAADIAHPPPPMQYHFVVQRLEGPPITTTTFQVADAQPDASLDTLFQQDPTPQPLEPYAYSLVGECSVP